MNIKDEMIMKERQISVTDILLCILVRWKFIVACIVFFSILLGIYGYYTENEKLSNNSVEPTEEKVSFDNLDSNEKTGLMRVLDLDERIADKQEYIADSILMQINPYEKETIVLKYYIELEHIEDEVSIKPIVDLYSSYINDSMYLDSAVEKMSWNKEAYYLDELVSFGHTCVEQNENQHVFNIYITGKDKKQAEEIADVVDSCIVSYHKKVDSNVKLHSLTNIERSYVCVYDAELRQYQNTVKDSLYSDETTRQSMVNTFSSSQNEVYNNMTGNTLVESQMVPVSADISIKKICLFVFIGAAIGFFISCLWVGFVYVWSTKITSKQDIQEMYSLSVIGELSCDDKINKAINKLSGGIYRSAGEKEKLLYNKIKRIIRDNKVEKIAFLTSLENISDNNERIQHLIETLKNDVQIVFYNDILHDIDAYEEIADIKNVIIAETIGVTKYNELEQEIRICYNYNVNILGVVVIC